MPGRLQQHRPTSRDGRRLLFVLNHRKGRPLPSICGEYRENVAKLVHVADFVQSLNEPVPRVNRRLTPGVSQQTEQETTCRGCGVGSA